MWKLTGMPCIFFDGDTSGVSMSPWASTQMRHIRSCQLIRKYSTITSEGYSKIVKVLDAIHYWLNLETQHKRHITTLCLGVVVFPCCADCYIVLLLCWVSWRIVLSPQNYIFMKCQYKWPYNAVVCLNSLKSGTQIENFQQKISLNIILETFDISWAS